MKTQEETRNIVADQLRREGYPDHSFTPVEGFEVDLVAYNTGVAAKTRAFFSILNPYPGSESDLRSYVSKIVGLHKQHRN